MDLEGQDAGSGGDAPGASGSGGNASGTGGTAVQGGGPQGGEPATGGVATGSGGGSAPMTGGAASGGGAGAPNGQGGDGGAATGGQECDTSQPFGAAVPVAGLNTEYLEDSARLTSDELAVVFFARMPDGDDVTDADVYFAERGSLDEPFGTPEPLSFNQEERDEADPWISDDRLTVLFDVDTARSEAISYGDDFVLSTRDSVDAPFGAEQTLVNGWAPFVVGGGNGFLYYLTRDLTLAGGIYQTALSDWSPVGNPVRVVSTMPLGKRFAVSSDHLTIYFDYGTAGEPTIQLSERIDIEDSFGEPELVSELGGEMMLGPDWLSPDKCRIYFTVDLDVDTPGTGNTDIMVAERGP